MRTENSAKSAVTSIIMNFFYIIFGVVTQSIFIKKLGNEILGINGLFNNIISMLSIVELGIGSAIIYKLYKPLYDNDLKKVNALMNYYKNAYRIISLIVLIVGLLIIPFLPSIIGNITVNINIYFIYLLFLFDACISYLLVYKKSIVQADQKNYIVNIIHLFYLLIMNIAQIIALYTYKSFSIYIFIRIFSKLLENITISIYADINYKEMLSNKYLKIDKDSRNDITKKIKALFFHKIAAYIVSGTDSIIISKFLGIVYVGLYSNYLFIINSVTTLFGQVFTSITGSVGNLLVENNKNKNFEIYKKLSFLNFTIYSFATISIYLLTDSFIEAWIGKEYIISESFLIAISVYFYLRGMRSSISVFKDAAGIFYEDRFIPIIEAITNLVTSIILVKYFGLLGVILGTIISTLVLFIISYPKYIYNPLFNRKGFLYIIEQIKYGIVLVIMLSISHIIKANINLINPLIELIILGLLSVGIFSIIFLLFYGRSDLFKYYINLIKSNFTKKEKKHDN